MRGLPSLYDFPKGFKIHKARWLQRAGSASFSAGHSRCQLHSQRHRNGWKVEVYHDPPELHEQRCGWGEFVRCTPSRAVRRPARAEIRAGALRRMHLWWGSRSRRAPRPAARPRRLGARERAWIVKLDRCRSSCVGVLAADVAVISGTFGGSTAAPHLRALLTIAHKRRCAGSLRGAGSGGQGAR